MTTEGTVPNGSRTAAAVEPGTRSTLPATAGETSAATPWPLHVLSEKLKAHIERAPAAWVEGQVIEFNRRNGLSFLTLRDVDTEVSLSVTVFSSVLDRLALPLEQGTRVVAQLKADFWVKTGRLSMQARDIRPVGLGDLLARIERLRRLLSAEGLFSAQRKRRLPLLPHRIGLITGRGSDAMKDVMRNAALRWPAVDFEVREVAVQGPGCVPQVTAALAELDALADVDVIIIARGGGSLEDLLPFSSEEMVRAVAAAHTPVVSAIGHEADRPLVDEVADLRASTPTDAAKRVVPDVAEELNRISQARAALTRSLGQLLARETERLNQLRSRPSLARPEGMIDVREADVERLRNRAHLSVDSAVTRHADGVRHLRAQVRALSPQNTLDRGYAVVQRGDGSVVLEAAAVPAGTDLSIKVAVGRMSARATGTLPDPTSGGSPGEASSTRSTAAPESPESSGKENR
ncbi:exodeoxyribonuclease VII large subunit [Arthrobacter crusticola]|uniref:Exodeoxyribonuclease 7 large subunit n=1 Tax=Arthrobacter crusticola TaxID=2547960 RepID=A0A4R5TXC3_9MICC|nr:exodeoxyribonuclease VII large subunit [Arthrobacter crusticola]TDK25823.1 exodeoxyribonuclease VII large subunit [Arthrobacter crusticola]